MVIHYLYDSKIRGWADCGLFIRNPVLNKAEGHSTTHKPALVTCKKCKDFIKTSKSLHRHFDVLNSTLKLNLPRPRLIKERISEHKQRIWACAYFSPYESMLRPTIDFSPAIVIHNGYVKPWMIRGLILHEILHYQAWINDPLIYNKKNRRNSHTKAFDKKLSNMVDEFRRLRPTLKIHKLY